YEANARGAKSHHLHNPFLWGCNRGGRIVSAGGHGAIGILDDIAEWGRNHSRSEPDPGHCEGTGGCPRAQDQVTSRGSGSAAIGPRGNARTSGPVVQGRSG